MLMMMIKMQRIINFPKKRASDQKKFYEENYMLQQIIVYTENFEKQFLQMLKVCCHMQKANESEHW